MNRVNLEITAINGHFERLTTYVIIHSHRVNIAHIYPAEGGYEVYPNSHGVNVFKFAHLTEAVSFVKGIAFANGTSGYLFANDWRQAELKAYKKSYHRHKSKSR